MYVNILVILNANELSLMLCFSYVVFQYIYFEASRRSKESQAHHLHFKEILLLRRIWFLNQGSFLFIFFLGKNTQTRCRDFATRPRRSISLGYSLFKFNWQSSKGSKLWSQNNFSFHHCCQLCFHDS